MVWSNKACQVMANGDLKGLIKFYEARLWQQLLDSMIQINREYWVSIFWNQVLPGKALKMLDDL